MSFDTMDDANVQRIMSQFSPRAIIEGMEAGTSVEFNPANITKSTLSFHIWKLAKKYGREYHLRTIKSRNTYQITREA